MPKYREIVRARQALPQTVGAAFLPLEESADQTAALGLRCLATMIESRRTAALGVTDGAEAIRLIQAGCNMAMEAQALIRQAHANLVDVADQLDIDVHAYAPDCPGVVRTTGDAAHLSVVA